MYCTGCGKQLEDDDRFCSKCGRATSPTVPPAPPAKKRLVRRVSDGKIAGVCAGFAAYFGVDVTLMRLIWIAAIFLHGASLIAYAIAWIVIPKEDRPAQEGQGWQRA